MLTSICSSTWTRRRWNGGVCTSLKGKQKTWVREVDMEREEMRQLHCKCVNVCVVNIYTCGTGVFICVWVVYMCMHVLEWVCVHLCVSIWSVCVCMCWVCIYVCECMYIYVRVYLDMWRGVCVNEWRGRMYEDGVLSMAIHE